MYSSTLYVVLHPCATPIKFVLSSQLYWAKHVWAILVTVSCCVTIMYGLIWMFVHKWLIVTTRNVHHVPFQVQHRYCLMAAFINATHKTHGCVHTDDYRFILRMKTMSFFVVVRTCANILYREWFDEVLLLLPTIHDFTTCSYYMWIKKHNSKEQDSDDRNEGGEDTISRTCVNTYRLQTQQCQNST